MLVFLPGQEEIENLHNLLEEHLPYICMKKSKNADIDIVVEEKIVEESKEISSTEPKIGSYVCINVFIHD